MASNNCLLSASLDGTVRARDLLRYRNFRTFTTPSSRQFVSLAADQSGEVICAGTSDSFERVDCLHSTGMEEEDKNNAVRIFVGGLSESVTDEDLRRLFGSLGTVEGIETIRTKGRSFAYLDFLPSPTDLNSLSKLFSKYNGCVWKGGKLRLEKAKEHYLVRLKREWEEDAPVNVSNKEPTATDLSAGKDLKEMPSSGRISKLNTDRLNIFFPRLKKVKSIPFSGTGKHKYSFQNIKVPPLPVHFCDCEEHCSPYVTEKKKLSFDGAAESGGMNDEEINIMKAVMNKLLEKEKFSNIKNSEEEQDSLESPDVKHQDECEADSATDEDDLIINMETKKNKTTLIGSEELARILENQDLWSNKEERDKSMVQVQKRSNSSPNKVKKRKSLPTLERESKECASTTPGDKSNMQILPDEMESGPQPTELEGGLAESAKVSWSQKSSWRELLGDGGNASFSASLILPKSDSGKSQQRSDDLCTPLSSNKKAKNIKRNRNSGNKPTNTQMIEELAEAQPTDEQVTEDLAEAQPTDEQVIKEIAEAQPTDEQVIKEIAEAQPTNKQVIKDHVESQHIVASNKTGRGASWRQKQSWTQLVSENSSSFSISHILPDISFPEPIAKEPAGFNDCKQNGVAKDTINKVVSGGFNLGEIIPEKNQHAGADNIASAPAVEEKIEMSPRERSTEDVEISQTCSFMRNAASLKEWAKAKAALSGSLKRKHVEK